jgi:hypothetical protein
MSASREKQIRKLEQQAAKIEKWLSENEKKIGENKLTFEFFSSTDTYQNTLYGNAR